MERRIRSLNLVGRTTAAAAAATAAAAPAAPAPAAVIAARD